MVSSLERTHSGFLENGESLRIVGSKEEFGSEVWAGRGRMVQGAATARTSSSREGESCGNECREVCRTALTRNGGLPGSCVLSKGKGHVCGFSHPSSGRGDWPQVGSLRNRREYRAGERPSHRHRNALSL